MTSFRGAGLLGKNDIKWGGGQADSTGTPPDQKVNKAEQLTYLSKNIGKNVCHSVQLFCHCTGLEHLELCDT
jgi:hypothetical protein